MCVDKIKKIKNHFEKQKLKKKKQKKKQKKIKL